MYDTINGSIALLKEAREELKNGVDAGDVEAEIEDIREDSGMTGKPEKEVAEFEEHINFYKYLDSLENDEALIKVFGSKEAVGEYAGTVRKAYRGLKEELRGDFENTIKDAVKAVKNGLVEKNTNDDILKIVKSSEVNMNPNELYLYEELPYKDLPNTIGAKMEKAWEEILKNLPLSKGFGRVVKIKKSVLDELLKTEDLKKIKEILSDMKYQDKYEFGSGKGIFRVGDVRGKTTEEIMKELAMPKGDLEEGYVYAVIEIKTDKEPGIFENLKELREAKAKWHWPFTGNGFTANAEGEIIPEYYLLKGFKDDDINILGFKIITDKGEVASVGEWG